MTRRAAGHQQARERWRIGQPYAGSEQQTLVVLPRHPAEPLPRPVAEQPPRYPLNQKAPVTAAWITAAVTLIITAATKDPLALSGLTASLSALGWAGRRLARTQRALAEALPLDLVAHAICDAYRQLGELSDQAAGSLAIEPRSSCYLRCYLRTASAAESERFTRALDQALSPAAFPRYLISRLVPSPSHIPLRPLTRVLSGKAPFDRRWVAIPDDLGRSKQRAEAYATAWRRWLGPAELQFTQRTVAGREAAAGADAQRSDYQTSSRRIWV
jgi:hypothetical protein